VPAWIAYFACRKTSAQFMTTCHGYYKNRFFSQIMGWSKYVIVISEIIGRHMVEDFKVSNDRIRVIHRSVDLNKFKPKKFNSSSEPTCNIAIVGRITQLKGHDYFLKAMAQVVRNIPYAKIKIIGDAPRSKEAYLQELKHLVSRLNLEDKVEFLGNRSDIPELLAQTDVLVLSTVTPEAFGRVIIEAQAVGVPVVATKVGGVVDIIEDEKSGLLVMPRDVDAMAKAVLRILRDKALAERLVEEARKKIDEKFTLEHMALKTIGVYEELLSSVNILVIKIGAIGDVILVLPSLKAIRKKFPKAKIFCLVGEQSKQVLQKCPYLDGLIVADFAHKQRGWPRLIKFSKKLRKYHFDKVIDFQNNRKSHLLSFLSFPHESFGYDNGKWGFLLTHPLKNNQRNLAPVEHQFKILEQLGIPYRDNAALELYPSRHDEKYIDKLLESEWLSGAQNIVGINLAASAKWPTKNWPIEHVARLCDMLSNKNIRVIVTGLPKDKPLAQELLSLTKSKPAMLIGKTDILQLASLIDRCKVFITPDSAPMHVAAAVKTPIIAFFGPTDSVRHQPPAKNIVILEKKLQCAPCYSGRCKILTHTCMKEIKPEEVFEQVVKFIEESVTHK